MEQGDSSGRGRGRGRGGGGIAVLPSGLWQSLRTAGDDDKDGDDKIAIPRSLHDDDDDNNNDDDGRYDDYDDNNDNNNSNDNDGNNGKPVSSKSVSTSKPDWAKTTDWSCDKCSNVNWEWRQACNKCNNPKPKELNDKFFKEKFKKKDEHRDGHGGGFNEKQERAMNVLKVEVDDEGFDDFGRRVKKENVDKKAKEEAALKRLNQSYGFLLTGQLPPDIKLNKTATTNDKDTKGNDKNDKRRDIDRRDRNDRRRSRSRDRNDRRRSRSRDRNDRRRSRSNERRRSRSRDRNDRRR